MLDCLKISQFALIESAELEFGSSFNVVTGESGAGKSIIMGALELLLGGRADKSVIRTGADRAEIAGLFTVPAPLLALMQTLFEENDLELDQERPSIQFRRVVGNHSVRNYINDTLVSARLLRTIGEYLVDFHGANDQLSLLIPGRQLELLDRYAGAEAEQQICADLFRQLENLKREREDFLKHLPNDAERERLELVLEDIDKVNPAEQEDVELGGRYKLAANAREIIENAEAMRQAISENENCVIDQLIGVYRKLQELAKISETMLAPLLEDCDLLQENLQTFAGKLEQLGQSVEVNPEELQTMESRLSELFTLKRRYGPTLEQVFETRKNAIGQLELHRQTLHRQAEFDVQEKQLRAQLAEHSAVLSQRRKGAAERFCREVQEKLTKLGFLKCRMEIAFTDIEPGAHGSDRIEMVFSANTGEELRPLRRIASSGELSRLMLALKTVLADADSIPVVVFDEIDVNIGGETANAVGRELRKLGEHRQILAISHLAQVAACANVHFKVEKHDSNNRTYSQSRILSDSEREQEIARMIGGGDAALPHAKAILKTAGKNS